MSRMHTYLKVLAWFAAIGFSITAWFYILSHFRSLSVLIGVVLLILVYVLIAENSYRHRDKGVDRNYVPLDEDEDTGVYFD